MTSVLVVILVVWIIAGRWLSQQRLASKPWLETGLDSVDDSADRMIRLPRAKMGLIVFLMVASALFAMFASGYFMRQEMADWQTPPLPRILWLNTGVLMLGSVFLQLALVAARNGDIHAVRIRLATTWVVDLGFLVGQLIAWRQLTDSGYILAGNPANSFFYLITGIHGLHVVGGLVALGRVTVAARGDDIPIEKLRLRIDLCALYWHFLLFVWFVLLAVLLGWVSDPFFDISHH